MAASLFIFNVISSVSREIYPVTGSCLEIGHDTI